MLIPPSMEMLAPFMKAASSDAANRMAAAISSSVPSRPMGWRARQSALAFSKNRYRTPIGS